MKLGALIDGLAIQVLMNDSEVGPEHMQRMCQEVAASLIGFELEPARRPSCIRYVRSEPGGR